VPVEPDDPLTLMTSSGTSSVRPKLCVHTHGGQLGNAAATAADGAARADDTVLSCSPFTHLFGLLAIHLSLVMGGRQALLPHWSVDGLLDVATRARASVLFAVPAQLRDLVAAGARLRLREVRTGGAPVPADLVTSAGDVLGAGLVVQWGMSEVGAGICTRPGDPVETVATTIGRPVSGALARIVGHDGVPPPPGEVGELWFKAPTMFRGYLADPERTSEAVTGDGWLRTGDLASWTADGTIAYRGRRTELINRGGVKFSAVEVENLLAELPQLAQFAVVDRPDERLGQRAVLVAALRPGHQLSLDGVTDHLRARGLARYKWPEQLLVVDELPTTPTGKIARVRLKHVIERGVSVIP
jgi:cyclohexanecarboxylate-CoA ligase